MKPNDHNRSIPVEDEQKTATAFMELGKALEIVLELARARSRSHPIETYVFDELQTTMAEVQCALDTVEDFIVNHFEKDDEAHDKSCENRLSALFDALKHHGNVEGTKAQLGDAEALLRLAFTSMTPTQQTEFLNNQDVI